MFARAACLMVIAGSASSCGLLPADVRKGCYRFADGAPLFRVVGKEAHFVTSSHVKSFRIGGWHELSRKSVEIVPALVLPGLPAGDPDRGNAEPIPSISYTKFAFDPRRNSFRIPIAAWGEQEVTLGAPC